MFVIADSDKFLVLVIMSSLMSLVLAACYYDCCQRRIPNILTLGGAAWAALLHTILGGLDGLILALGGMVVGFIFLIPGYALGKTGAGDVKLLAAVGTFVGPFPAVVAAASSILAGGIMALCVALLARGESPWSRYGAMFRYLWVVGRWDYVPPREGEVMAGSFPFAPAIALGATCGSGYYLLHVNPFLSLS